MSSGAVSLRDSSSEGILRYPGWASIGLVWISEHCWTVDLAMKKNLGAGGIGIGRGQGSGSVVVGGGDGILVGEGVGLVWEGPAWVSVSAAMSEIVSV